jgi:hypothetical protein
MNSTASPISIRRALTASWTSPSLRSPRVRCALIASLGSSPRRVVSSLRLLLVADLGSVGLYRWKVRDKEEGWNTPRRSS